MNDRISQLIHCAHRFGILHGLFNDLVPLLFGVDLTNMFYFGDGHIRLAGKPFITEPPYFARSPLILDNVRLGYFSLLVQESIFLQGCEQLIEGGIDLYPLLPGGICSDNTHIAILVHIQGSCSIRVGRQVIIVLSGLICHIAGKGSGCHLNGAVPVIAVFVV